MSRRFAEAVLIAGAAFASASAAADEAPAPADPRRLNVLLILVDDLNCSLSCYGNPPAKTPHIDRLAARGVRFERAYCQYPLCNPSRTSLLSGLRPETTRIASNAQPPRRTLPAAVFLPGHFRRNGYFTAQVGKIAHQRFDDRADWDELDPNVPPDPFKLRMIALGVGAGLLPAGLVIALFTRGRAGRRRRLVAGIPLVLGAGSTAALAVSALQYVLPASSTAGLAVERPDASADDLTDGRCAGGIIRLLERRPADKPFFLAAGFVRPHRPFEAPSRFFRMYPLDRTPLPDEPADHMGNVPEPAAAGAVRFGDGVPPNEQRRMRAAYFACVSYVDEQIGRILTALDRLKLWDDTVVVLAGDHGYHLGEHGGLWEKGTLFEEAARVPLIVAAPGRRAGVACPRPVELVDLYPTLAALCRLPAPAAVEGVDFSPLLDDPVRPWKAAAFTVVARGPGVFGRRVRTERFAYTEWTGGAAQLYDLHADPREFVNLAGDPAHADTVARMRELLRGGWKAALPVR
jgi:uncharacterized sulfatase